MLIMAGTFALGLVLHFILGLLEGDFDPEHSDGDVATSSGSTSSKLVDESGAPNDG